MSTKTYLVRRIVEVVRYEYALSSVRADSAEEAKEQAMDLSFEGKGNWRATHSEDGRVTAQRFIVLSDEEKRALCAPVAH